jgi:hypothetical protein
VPDTTTLALNDEHFAEIKAVMGEQAFMNAILRVELRRATAQAQERPPLKDVSARRAGGET